MSVLHPALLLGTALVTINVLQSILAQLITVKAIAPAFYLSAVVFSTECLKLLMAGLSTLFYLYKTNTREVPTQRTVLSMAIPAVLYTISNTLTYHSIAMMGSTNFQIWGNLRIFFTAVLSRVVVGRPMRILQWVAIFLLLVGASAPSAMACNHQHTPSTPSAPAILCITAQTLCTSLAGVYQEMTFKSSDQHFTVKNAALYTWTCIFCGLKLQADFQSSDAGLFSGFSAITWICVVVYACYGQVVSLTLAYCDNLVKVFATSFAATATLVVDALMLGRDVENGQVLGAAMVFVSTGLFYVDVERLSKLL